jgi:hypothetical protein
MMDYQGLVKRIQLPPGTQVPRELDFEDLELHALGREHLADDVAGINASLDLIPRTRGGSWPSGPVTEESNFVDLVWHECEFRDGKSFTYGIYHGDGTYLGCCYLYPMGVRRPLTEELARHDVDVSWWVTPEAYRDGYYAKTYAALTAWLGDRLPFTAPYFSNVEIPSAPSPAGRSLPST